MRNLRIFNFLDLWKYQIKTLWSVNFSISFHTWTLKLLLRFFEMRCFYFLICVKRTQDPPPPLSEIVQLSFRYISFHEVSHWNKPFFCYYFTYHKNISVTLKNRRVKNRNDLRELESIQLEKTSPVIHLSKGDPVHSNVRHLHFKLTKMSWRP